MAKTCRSEDVLAICDLQPKSLSSSDTHLEGKGTDSVIRTETLSAICVLQPKSLSSSDILQRQYLFTSDRHMQK
eukprot:scaffold442_cov268-Pinguiococcus_pyrenoidosus.AAC.122